MTIERAMTVTAELRVTCMDCGTRNGEFSIYCVSCHTRLPCDSRLNDDAGLPTHAGVGPHNQLVLPKEMARYRVQGHADAGAFGLVFPAWDRQLGRRVAIKMVNPGNRAGKTRIRRMIHEARAVALLNHPHVVTIYDLVQAGGNIFLVMEWLKGSTLKAVMQKGRLERASALRLAS